MSTYTKFSRLSLAAKIRLREKFTSEIFYRQKYPDLRYVTVYILYEIFELYPEYPLVCSEGMKLRLQLW